MPHPKPDSVPIRAEETSEGSMALLKTTANSMAIAAHATATMIGTGSTAPCPGTANQRHAAAAMNIIENSASHGLRRPVWSAMEPMTGDTSAITSPA